MPSLIVLILAIGATGLFLALPSGRRDLARIGWVLLAAASGTVLAIGVRALVGEAGWGWFAGCALVAVFAAVRVITHRQPVYSALYFVLLVVAVAGQLVLMQAEFLAAALLLVYAGAILVTYVFVIMLAQQARPAPYDVRAREPFLGCLCGFTLLTVMSAQLWLAPQEVAGAGAAGLSGTVEAVGTPLLTQYVVGIQIAGVLLLAAMVGAIAIAQRKPVQRDTGGEAED